jgi:exodeoxyribonuclease V alpha subunit
MPTIETEAARLVGRLSEWNARGQKGWGFGKLTDEAGAVHSIKGRTLGARVGLTLELVGHWQDDPTYGRQFDIRTCVARVPSDASGVIAWIRDTFPNVGAKRAAALLEHFGGPDALWRVVEHEHERLAEVSGITGETAERIRAAYLEDKCDRDNKIKLRGWGLTDSQIARCLKEWKTLDTVVQRVSANPFQLTHHVHGFGFKKADEVAARAKMPHDAPERIRAALEFVLEQAIDAGHCFISGAQLQRDAVKLLGVPPKLVAREIYRASQHKVVARRARDWRCYSSRMERLEAAAAEQVAMLITSDAVEETDDPHASLETTDPVPPRDLFN